MPEVAEATQAVGGLRTPHRAGRLVASVGAVVGLAIMGDSLMYAILPLAAPDLGIALPLVGILLSANRLVRLVSNSWASSLFERRQPRLPFLLAAGLGLAATLIYGLAAGFRLFLAARIVWGIAWSGLRQGGYQAIWTGADNARGRLTGLLWGLVRLGSAISVLVGGWLFDRHGYGAAVGMAIAAAVAAALLAAGMRWPRIAHTGAVVADQIHRGDGKESAWRAALRHPIQRWLVITGFFQYLLSGIVVSTTALFVASQLSQGNGLVMLGIGAATLTGMLQGIRWLTDLGLGPLVGAASDRIGQDNTAALVGLVMVAAVAGAVTLPPPGAIGCLFVILLCDGALHIVMSAAASGAALTTGRPHAFIGVFTTTTDAGSAFGPLVAYSFVVAVGLPLVYGCGAALLAVALANYWRQSRRSIQV